MPVGIATLGLDAIIPAAVDLPAVVEAAMVVAGTLAVVEATMAVVVDTPAAEATMAVVHTPVVTAAVVTVAAVRVAEATGNHRKVS